MEVRIENLEQCLRAMSGALRLRGVWPEQEPKENLDMPENNPSQVMRLRERTIPDCPG